VASGQSLYWLRYKRKCEMTFLNFLLLQNHFHTCNSHNICTTGASLQNLHQLTNKTYSRQLENTGTILLTHTHTYLHGGNETNHKKRYWSNMALRCDHRLHSTALTLTTDYPAIQWQAWLLLLFKYWIHTNRYQHYINHYQIWKQFMFTVVYWHHMNIYIYLLFLYQFLHL
jgi:hypothetical protein